MPKIHRTAVPRIESFDLERGRVLAGKYMVLSCLGGGWEGEVYRVREMGTGIDRAAKLFYPHRNLGQRVSRFHARKLHKLRDCPILIQYHTEEMIRYKTLPVRLMISEYVDGELLDDFLDRQPGKRMDVSSALHLLHALLLGVECIHRRGEYHGDIHSANIILRRRGLSFDVKLIDFFRREGNSRLLMRDDLFNLIRIFYDALGGPRHYARHPPVVKAVCCGLKQSLILRKFGTARKLRLHLETMEWD